MNNKIGKILTVMVCVVMVATVFAVAVPTNVIAQATVEKPATVGATLTIAVAAEPVKLDPHDSGDGASFYIYDYMLEGLVGWDRESKLAPALGTSWEFSENGTQVTVQLRKGVMLSDGTKCHSGFQSSEPGVAGSNPSRRATY